MKHDVFTHPLANLKNAERHFEEKEDQDIPDVLKSPATNIEPETLKASLCASFSG